MMTTRALLVVTLACTGLGLAACANDSSPSGPNPYYAEKPFQQTNPGPMDINGKESVLPNSPGDHGGGPSYSSPNGMGK